LRNSKIVLRDGLGEFWRVYIYFSNSIYVVIIFLKLKIYKYIVLSFLLKIGFSKNAKDFSIFLYIFHPKTLSSPPFQTPEQRDFEFGWKF